jgi:RES domain-containing protein
MVLYRITSKAYVRDLSGTGAFLYGGRWNKKGTRMVYASASLSLAALEIVANLSADNLDKSLYCAEIKLPKNLEITTLENLPDNWNAFPYSDQTVSIGSKFIENNGLCLKVPSAIIPTEYNYLFNPLHDDFHKVKFLDARPLILEKRLVRNVAK